MPELKEVFEMVTKQTEPELDSWMEQEQRQRRTVRNRKLGAFVLAAALAAGVVVVAAAQDPAVDEKTPATPAIPTPPLGATFVGLDGTRTGSIPGMPDDATLLELSPDGTTVAFRTYGVGGYLVATIGTDGSRLRIMTDIEAGVGDERGGLAWSPDGTRLAFSADDDIYVMNADGSGVRRLTSDPLGDYDPTWSPDGKTIAYWNGGRKPYDAGPPDAEIWTIPAEGGRPTRLTNDDIPDIEPAWSADGREIAYTHSAEIYVMRADGSDQHRVARDASFAPSWSPDGAKIAFLTYDPSERGIIPAPELGEGEVSDAPLLIVRVLDLRTGDVRNLGMRVATNGQGPKWLSSDALLVNRYD